MIINLKILNEYVERGLIVRQKHPTYPIWIYNYSRDCQIGNHWDNITMSCRGLVIDEDGNIIGRPFTKFFNWEQLKSVGLSVPDEPFDVYEKMDGSLIITFYYMNEWIVASRGSFISDYAVKAKEILDKKYNVNLLSKSNTYCFELLWREHVIVLTPEKDDVILLGSFITSNGKEINVQTDYYKNNFNVVKKYDGITDIAKIKETIGPDREGVVVRFKNGFRMKIKGEEYIRLHKIITNLSTIDIWEALKNNVDLSVFFEKVPDEFDTWVKEQINILNNEFSLVWERSVEFYNRLYYKFNGDFSERKHVVQEMNKYYDSRYHPILFKMIDENFVDDIIWKNLRPKFKKLNF